MRDENYTKIILNTKKNNWMKGKFVASQNRTWGSHQNPKPFAKIKHKN